MKGYTDFALGMLGPETLGYTRGELKFFDWAKAKDIIDNAVAENPSCRISVGLREDWNNTSDVVYDGGKWCEATWFYGCSSWATPIIDIEGEEIECWTYEETKERDSVAQWVLERAGVLNV